MNKIASFTRKVEMLRDVIAELQAESLMLSSQVTTSWLTGARSFVNMAADAACFKVMVTPERVVVLVNNIEAMRLLEEEMEGLPVEVEQYLWYEGEPSVKQIITEDAMKDRLWKLQAVLDDYEAANLEQLSSEVTHSLETVLPQLQRGMTEFSVAGAVSRQLWEKGIEPVVLLVGGDERSKLRRHALPTANPVNEYMIVAVCGRRRGLIASATRSVSFGQPSADRIARHEATCYIDALAIAHSKPGVSLGQVLAVMKNGYEARGYPDEWKQHHQGGITGYRTRVRLATPVDTETLQAGMGVAWNPSIAGTKSEDTCLVTENGGKILAAPSGNWPMVECTSASGVIKRPGIFVI
ncbi:M24 family metallopeptidase [Alicyclobacillus fodiniaquatilis]|uniref:M24 family metallopeptidase n=1 Tax=Alicyclobacillus fodiniaquatilis TaxID=1661150 RepID=A0ABW4JMY6_9BACL